MDVDSEPVAERVMDQRHSHTGLTSAHPEDEDREQQPRGPVYRSQPLQASEGLADPESGPTAIEEEGYVRPSLLSEDGGVPLTVSCQSDEMFEGVGVYPPEPTKHTMHSSINNRPYRGDGQNPERRMRDAEWFRSDPEPNLEYDAPRGLGKTASMQPERDPRLHQVPDSTELFTTKHSATELEASLPPKETKPTSYHMSIASRPQDDPITSERRRNRDAIVFGSDPEPSLLHSQKEKRPGFARDMSATDLCRESQDTEIEYIEEIFEDVSEDGLDSNAQSTDAAHPSEVASQPSQEAASVGAAAVEEPAPVDHVEPEKPLATTASDDARAAETPLEEPAADHHRESDDGEGLVPVYEEKTRSGNIVYRARRMPMQGWDGSSLSRSSEESPSVTATSQQPLQTPEASSSNPSSTPPLPKGLQTYPSKNSAAGAADADAANASLDDKRLLRFSSDSAKHPPRLSSSKVSSPERTSQEATGLPAAPLRNSSAMKAASNSKSGGGAAFAYARSMSPGHSREGDEGEKPGAMMPKEARQHHALSDDRKPNYGLQEPPLPDRSNASPEDDGEYSYDQAQGQELSTERSSGTSPAPELSLRCAGLTGPQAFRESSDHHQWKSSAAPQQRETPGTFARASIRRGLQTTTRILDEQDNTLKALSPVIGLPDFEEQMHHYSMKETTTGWLLERMVQEGEKAGHTEVEVLTSIHQEANSLIQQGFDEDEALDRAMVEVASRFRLNGTHQQPDEEPDDEADEPDPADEHCQDHTADPPRPLDTQLPSGTVMTAGYTTARKQKASLLLSTGARQHDTEALREASTALNAARWKLVGLEGTPSFVLARLPPWRLKHYCRDVIYDLSEAIHMLAGCLSAAVGPELAHLQLSQQLEDVEERLQGFVEENLNVDSENFWQVLMGCDEAVRASMDWEAVKRVHEEFARSQLPDPPRSPLRAVSPPKQRPPGPDFLLHNPPNRYEYPASPKPPPMQRPKTSPAMMAAADPPASSRSRQSRDGSLLMARSSGGATIRTNNSMHSSRGSTESFGGEDEAMQWLLTGGSQRSRLATSEEIKKIKVRLGPRLPGTPGGTPHSTPMHRRYPSLGAKSVGFADSVGFESSGETLQSPRDDSPGAKSVGFAADDRAGFEVRGETLPSPQVADSPTVGDVIPAQ